ncbi:MAG TPA: helix-turn-helix transcriptional regulator [Bryobacteraceae bacterium]|nr:helix-turn-helix transcriptional regulator [Bryobacteraceae bacterium]
MNEFGRPFANCLIDTARINAALKPLGNRRAVHFKVACDLRRLAIMPQKKPPKLGSRHLVIPFPLQQSCGLHNTTIRYPSKLVKGTMSGNREVIQNALRKLRKERGLTQVQLANALDIAPTSIYRWEAGASSPDMSMLLGLWHFAMRTGTSEAAAELAHVLMEESPVLKPLVEQTRFEAQKSLEEWAGSLPEDQQNLVAGLIAFLQESTDETAHKIIKVILEPWIIPTKAVMLHLGLGHALQESEATQDRDSKRKSAAKPKKSKSKPAHKS